jgi:hypothetical protein
VSTRKNRGLAANLDFFALFEEDKKMFLRKYPIKDGQHRFTRRNSVPIFKDLFSLVLSSWKTAHRE